MELDTKNKRLLLIAFFLSGMTALIYEIVWSRPLQMIFGSTIYAVSTILTTFFVGFSIGSLIFRNYADNSKNPGKLFAMLELGIGLYGLVILFLFGLVGKIYLALPEFGAGQFVRFALLFLVLIVPATLFGGTWPIVNKAFIHREKLGKDAGNLYSFNSIGSAIGSILAGFVLIPWIGIMSTSILVSFINIFLGAFIYFKFKDKVSKVEERSMVEVGNEA